MGAKNVRLPIPATLLVVTVSFLFTCNTPQAESEQQRRATDVALAWNHMLLELEWHTEGYRPPVTARMFAYAEMAAYEASLPALNGYVSLETHFKGYQKPHFIGSNFHLPAALNEAYADMADYFFPTAPTEFKVKAQKLKETFSREFQQSEADFQPSLEYGKSAALAVWKYSMLDTAGHDGFLYNYDKQYQAPVCEGCWTTSTERPMPPLLPKWGQVRPFIVSKSEIAVHPPVPYNDKAPSAFFSEAMEVFSISNSLTNEERWIAEFWSDDLPGLTITPTGRWISIANQAIAKSRPSFARVMEIYLKTAFALCDAAIVCWYNKYNYVVERPESYIRRKVSPDWQPLHNSPPFPSYPSGHAIFGAAASEILSAALGDHYCMEDCTHEGRKEFMGKPRKFDSFQDMANENAYSRVLIGVHFRMDCEEGLRLGKIIGKKIADFSLLKGQASALKTH